jgi:hypothetical protein
MSAAEQLIVLLERIGPADSSVRHVAAALRRTPRAVADQFDHYETLIDAVGAEQAAHIAVNAARAANQRWLAG